MNDMSATIIPKSDQWNYDDFLAGPITFKITGVKIRPGTEQPVDFVLEGTEKFYRPCKSMCRVAVTAWGSDASKYIGRSLTLYGDPLVKWGGMSVGGIRISHMSHIPEALTMALTATKGSRKPFTVRPLKSSAPPVTVAPPAAETSRSPDGADSPRHGDALRAAKTMAEFATAWNAIPKDQRAPFKPIRAEMEAKLALQPPDDFVSDYTDNEQA